MDGVNGKYEFPWRRLGAAVVLGSSAGLTVLLAAKILNWNRQQTLVRSALGGSFCFGGALVLGGKRAFTPVESSQGTSVSSSRLTQEALPSSSSGSTEESHLSSFVSSSTSSSTQEALPSSSLESTQEREVSSSFSTAPKKAKDIGGAGTVIMRSSSANSTASTAGRSTEATESTAVSEGEEVESSKPEPLWHPPQWCVKASDFYPVAGGQQVLLPNGEGQYQLLDAVTGQQVGDPFDGVTRVFSESREIELALVRGEKTFVWSDEANEWGELSGFKGFSEDSRGLVRVGTTYYEAKTKGKAKVLIRTLQGKLVHTVALKKGQTFQTLFVEKNKMYLICAQGDSRYVAIKAGDGKRVKRPIEGFVRFGRYCVNLARLDRENSLSHGQFRRLLVVDLLERERKTYSITLQDTEHYKISSLESVRHVYAHDKLLHVTTSEAHAFGSKIGPQAESSHFLIDPRAKKQPHVYLPNAIPGFGSAQWVSCIDGPKGRPLLVVLDGKGEAFVIDFRTKEVLFQSHQPLFIGQNVSGVTARWSKKQGLHLLVQAGRRVASFVLTANGASSKEEPVSLKQCSADLDSLSLDTLLKAASVKSGGVKGGYVQTVGLTPEKRVVAHCQVRGRHGVYITDKPLEIDGEVDRVYANGLGKAKVQLLVYTKEGGVSSFTLVVDLSTGKASKTEEHSMADRARELFMKSGESSPPPEGADT